MLGLIRGRLYYNLLNWYRVLALLPGYRVNRRFMEQMMGVKEPLPDELAARDRARASAAAASLDALYCVRTVAGLVANHLTLNRRIDAFYARLDRALAPPSPPLEDRRIDELVAHYRDLRAPAAAQLGCAARQRLLRDDLLRPAAQPGDALVRRRRAARCRTI